MATSKKQISISTNLSNGEIVYNYDDFKQSIICRYTNSNYDTLINPVFTTFIDDININDYSTSIVDINNYYSKYAFNVIYNLNKDLKRFDDLIFNNCSTLYSINNIPTSFTSVGKYAFSGCNNLRFLNLPDTIKEIKEFAFNGTNNLKTLNISNVTKLHNYSFSGCGIESIELNEDVDTLYHYLFKDCKNLKSFKNDHIVKIGEGVFCGCSNLEYVELSNAVQIYDDEKEYVETIEEIIEPENPDIGAKYTFYFYNSLGNLEKGMGDIETIENISEDDFLSRLVRFVITSHTEDNELISKTYYVLQDALTDESGEKYQLYDENGNAVNLSVRLYKAPSEPEIIPVEKWRLFDGNDNEIGYITEELADAIKAYDEANGNSKIETQDNGDGTEIIQLLNDVEYIEYYQDGITLTGRSFDDPMEFQSQDETQFIEKYKYYSVVDGNSIIQLTNDLNVNITFNEDYTECYAKMKGYPVYDANGEYVVYTMYEPFLSLRKEFDELLVLKDESNENVYIDNGFYIKYEGISAKYPVYNINYCFLGRLNNGEWLQYTNQVELDTFASKLESHEVEDEEGNPTGLVYFMMPSNYNYNSNDLEEGNIENTTNGIKEIIGEIIEYKTGTNPFAEDDEEGDTTEDPETTPEEEETLPEYDKFDLNALTYAGNKYMLPNMLFASCVKLHNNNILRAGNYNPVHSHVDITFYNIKDQSGYYSGKWEDTIGFLYYNPNDALYTYTFKWKYLTVLKVKYINIVLNGKNYYITEELSENKGFYERKLVDNIYDSPKIIEDFETDNLTKDESIFDINIFNTKLRFKFENYQKSIYDKYYLLDTINEVGNNTFMNCASLERINSHFEKIGDYAFKDCVNLESIPLNKAANIGKYAFQNCISLKEITLNYMTSNENKGIFYNCKNLQKINNFGLTEITDYLFKNCSSLETIKMTNITKVGKEAFYNCSKLNISLVNNSIKNITYFDDYAFFGCSNITSINFNEHITFLGKGVFKNCSKLETITLPSSINNFTEELFACCKNLKSITFTTPVIDEIVLSGIDFCNNIESIHIPEGGRYITPNDNCIFDTQTRTIVYVCKNISKFDIDNNFIANNTTLGRTINISDSAFNNCKLSIIEIDKNIITPNVNTNTFKGIKNRTYHILIDKKNDSKFDLYKELVGMSHLYFK